MYNHNLIEKKWIKKWKELKINYFKNDVNKPKFYALDMFPYPSGAGLHVGHVKSYIPNEIFSRYKKYQGFNVLHPIGWDAFGLPAEQYALKTKNHPHDFTQKNISNFKNQIEKLGFSFDVNKEIDTTDKNYYKWTQWIFLQLYKNNLAEIKEVDVNWCEELGTVLSNEEILTNKEGVKVSERGGHKVIKKPMKQWVLKITNYADKLVEDLDLVDWSEGLKNIQKKWIGKSIGATIKFDLQQNNFNFKNNYLSVFSSRPDTIFGVSFIGLSFDHFLVKKIVETNEDLKQLIKKQSDIKDFEKTAINFKKIGYLLPIYAIHPFTNKKIPIYACNYVLSNYGDGAIMGVPAHDLRDYDFAKQYNIEIIKVIESNLIPYVEDGKHINSEFLNELNIEDANNLIIKKLQEKKLGKKTVNYKLKDWLFSRQRYWGEPFPVLFDENGNILLDENLPLQLPYIEKINPSGDGKGPLATLKEWVYVKIGDKLYQRETNTMPQWAGSSWYYLAYLLKNDDGSYLPLNSKQAYELFERWLPVDVYVGGQEHAVLHLLYARFWHKFLYDIKIVPNKEPFFKLVNQGMILGSDKEKMSKSKGNIVNPIDLVESHGADSLRLYIAFMGPVNASLPWDDNAIDGINKWVNRVFRLFEIKKITDKNTNEQLEKKYHLFISKITNHIEKFEFNLAVSQMMLFINECYKYENIYKDFLKNFLIVLSCFAPFVSEELNEKYLNNDFSIFNFSWPKFDEKKIIEKTIMLPIQINGKKRDVIEINVEWTQQEIEKIAFESKNVLTWIKDKKILKKIYIKNKILNLIVN